MTQELYTVEKVAQILGLHVRTVRGYVRDGRIKAVKIGKQYRITKGDLEAFTGVPAPAAAHAPVPRKRFAEVASVTQIDVISMDVANRITNALMAVTNGPKDDTTPLRVDSIYDETNARLKIIVTGSIETTIGLLHIINLYAEQPQ
ncbi:MAG: helix-turn-helix domain-containing protein [Pseudomonadota bacterium]